MRTNSCTSIRVFGLGDGLLYANMGIPMVCESLPTMVLALLPVAFVEAVILAAILGTEFRYTWGAALRANLWSTLLGIPIAWFVLLALRIGTAPNGEIELSLRDGVPFVEFARPSPSLQAAITTAIRDVEDAYVGVRVVRVESDAANVIAKINADLLGATSR
jgi:hypothetical protein